MCGVESEVPGRVYKGRDPSVGVGVGSVLVRVSDSRGSLKICKCFIFRKDLYVCTHTHTWGVGGVCVGKISSLL